MFMLFFQVVMVVLYGGTVIFRKESPHVFYLIVKFSGTGCLLALV